MIKLKHIHVSFGSHQVLKDLTLHIHPGDRIALMGPSGSGKSTLLKLIAGQLKADSGTVEIAADRISYMFQEPRLLPWLTAAENVNLVLGDRPETIGTALQWLERVGLGSAASKRPHELSGGMRQRVALARALAYNGDVFLLDEPLSALDQALTAEMLSLISTYTAGKTVIFVTHDPKQAQAVSDTIIYLKATNP